MSEQNIAATTAQQASPQADAPRLPYSTLGIALGMAGTGSAWKLASILYGAPAAVAEVLFAISAAWWLVVVTARLPLTRNRVRQFLTDIQHPITGPFPAYVPVVALLLTGHYALYLPATLAGALCTFWVVVLTAMCAHMLSFWLSGALSLDYIHPGYALPVIAGPFIASMTLSTVGYSSAAIAAAAVGGFYWITLGTVIFLRLIHGAPLPASLAPTLSVLATPPATAGLAWFAIQDGETDAAQVALAGIVALFLCTQMFMIPRYLTGAFHLGYWAYMFPAAAISSYSLRWAGAQPGVLTTTIALITLVVASVLLLALSTATILMAKRSRAQT